MKLESLFFLFATAVLSGCLGSQSPIQTPPSTQEITRGNCNIQHIGDETGITLVCRSGSGLFPGDPFSSGNRASEFKLKAAIDNLQSGSDRFTLQVSNESLDSIAHLSTRTITLVDNLGNTYSPDSWAMREEGFKREIPPNTPIKLNYILDRPIDSNAASVQVILNGIWAQSVSSEFRDSMPPVRWTTNL